MFVESATAEVSIFACLLFLGILFKPSNTMQLYPDFNQISAEEDDANEMSFLEDAMNANNESPFDGDSDLK